MRMYKRHGFTIIELLVSMGLVILIMGVLASAFSVGLNVFSKLKAVGDMSDKLRAAATALRGDLSRDHFEGSARVSDPSFPTLKPREGFFMIRQTPSLIEGQADGINSYRSTSSVLYLTVKLKGNRRENFFGASCPAGSPLLTDPTTFFNQPAIARHQTGNVYTSQWAEVAYFLQPLKDPVTSVPVTGNGTPLFSLHRVVKVLIADNRAVNPKVPAGTPGYGGFSMAPAGGFNTPVDVTNVAKRSLPLATVNPADAAATPLTDVSTLLLTDVVSFTIQVIPAPKLPPTAPNALPPFGYPVGASEFQDVGAAADPVSGAAAFPGGTFESSTAASGLLAVQITLRVWDLRTQQTRQISIIQDL